jgi:parallel beta-helix repeat protein
VTVKNNRTEAHGSNGIGLNGAANSVVTNNRSEINRSAGINLNNAAVDNLVEKNEVFGNTDDGIRLQTNSDRNTVRLNHALKNGRDGIRVNDPGPAVTASSENTIERNVMLHNVEHDAHDNSAGSGTGLTANFWINNKCETDNRAGQLCEDH